MFDKIKKILLWVTEKWFDIIASGGSVVATWKAFKVYLPSMNGAYIWLICWSVGILTIILLPLRNGIKRKQKIYTENTTLSCNLTNTQLLFIKNQTHNISSYKAHCTQAVLCGAPMETNQDGAISVKEWRKQVGKPLEVSKQTFVVCVRFAQNINVIDSIKYTVEYENITKISEYKTLYFDKDFLVFSFVIEPVTSKCLKNVNQKITFTI